MWTNFSSREEEKSAETSLFSHVDLNKEEWGEA